MRLCFPAGAAHFHLSGGNTKCLVNVFVQILSDCKEKTKTFLGYQTLVTLTFDVHVFFLNTVKSSNTKLQDHISFPCSDGISCTGLCVYKC